jgi:DNA-binding CsgD family transcriptional regulator
MSIALSSDDVRRLRLTLETCLTPLAHAAPDQWGEAVVQRCMEMLGADSAIAWVPTSTGGRPHTMGGRAAESIAPYLEHYVEVDSGLNRYRAEQGLSVYSRDSIQAGYTTEAWRELYHDWLSPYRLFDSIGMSVPAPGSPFPFLVHAYHERESGPQFGERGFAMFELALPAFRAGLATLRQMELRREGLSRLIDELSSPVLLFDVSGRTCHESAAAAALLTADPEAERVRSEARRVATDLSKRVLGAPGEDAAAILHTRPTATLTTQQSRYSIVASVMPAGMLHARPLVVVVVERLTRTAPTANELRQKFGLTRRECDVARLLAIGKSNRAVSIELGISPHTAERHTERVLLKLGLNSRAGVAAKIFSVL